MEGTDFTFGHHIMSPCLHNPSLESTGPFTHAQLHRELHPISHSPEELFGRLLHTLKTICVATKKQAKIELHRLTDTCLPLADLGNSDWLLYLLQAYMRIFDDLFFSGSLMRRKPHRETALFVRPLTKVGLLGLTTTEGSYPNIYAEITISLISVPLDGSRRERQAEFRQRLGTLLHEMLHAYFELHYYCTCGNYGDGLRRACCSGLERIGVTGHRQCWFLAALALEDFAEAELKFKFDLGRAHAWEEEVAHTKPEYVARYWQMATRRLGSGTGDEVQMWRAIQPLGRLHFESE